MNVWTVSHSVSSQATLSAKNSHNAAKPAIPITHGLASTCRLARCSGSGIAPVLMAMPVARMLRYSRQPDNRLTLPAIPRISMMLISRRMRPIGRLGKIPSPDRTSGEDYRLRRFQTGRLRPCRRRHTSSRRHISLRDACLRSRRGQCSVRRSCRKGGRSRSSRR